MTKNLFNNLILVCSVGLFFTACTSDQTSVSAPNQICYDKYLDYRDVQKERYKDYFDEWKQGSCKGWIGNDCIGFDEYYEVGPIRECVENVEFK